MRHEAYLDNGGFGGSNRGASICADQDSSVTPLFKRAASRPGQGLRYAAIAHARSGPVSKSHGGETAKKSKSFTGLSTVARPETQPSDVPNFFQASPGVASSDPQTSDVPNFFQATPGGDSPKVAKAQSAYSTMETPLFTSTNELSSSDTTSGDTMSGDAPAADGAGTR